MKVIERSVMTCLYIREGASFSGAQIRELRREIWIAARAGKDTYFNKACWAVLFTIGAKGHLVDPEQFIDYRTGLAFCTVEPRRQRVRRLASGLERTVGRPEEPASSQGPIRLRLDAV